MAFSVDDLAEMVWYHLMLGAPTTNQAARNPTELAAAIDTLTTREPDPSPL